MLLECSHLSKAFGGVRAVDEVDLAVRPGEAVAIIGANGSGKSTLFNLISGVYKPTSGTITFNGERIDSMRSEGVARRGLVRTFQEATVFARLTVGEHFRLAERRAKKIRIRDYTARAEIWESLQHLWHIEAGSLPYGRQKLLGVNMALTLGPKMVLLDEPGAGISDEEQDELADVIRRMTANGLTMCIVDHDMDFVLPLVGRAVVMESGAIIFTGLPSDAFKSDRVRASYFGEHWKAYS